MDKAKVKAIYCQNRQEWRSWLEQNHLSEKEVWLIHHKKNSKTASVTLGEAVEEAVCFGWIDSQMKRLDAFKYRLRYSPRTGKSRWSVTNIERAEKMIALGKMTRAGLQVYQDAMKSGRRVPSSSDFTVPADLVKALAGNKQAQRNFDIMAASAKLVFVNWVDDAKTAETRQKRIKKTVELAAQNKKLA